MTRMNPDINEPVYIEEEEEEEPLPTLADTLTKEEYLLRAGECLDRATQMVGEESPSLTILAKLIRDKDLERAEELVKGMKKSMNFGQGLSPELKEATEDEEIVNRYAQGDPDISVEDFEKAKDKIYELRDLTTKGEEKFAEAKEAQEVAGRINKLAGSK